MGFGIALMVLAAFGSAALAATLVAASSDGVLGLGTALAANPRAAAAAAAATAFVATASFLVGLFRVVRARERRMQVVRADARAQEAERDAHARLLEMRLEQLRREVELMELRRDAAPGGLHSPLDLIDGDDGEEPIVVVLPENGREPTVLGQRLAEAARRPSPRG
jgi:hypothetical protein